MNRSLAIVVPVLIAAGVVTVFSMTRLQKAQARTVELEEQCDDVEVIMMLTSGSCFSSLKRNEKNRKKRFKRLPELHKQAFDAGIFKSEKPCYERPFEPYYLDKK